MLSKEKLKYKNILIRLAKYHNAEFVDNEIYNGIFFRFKCNNEIMTWDKIFIDENNGRHIEYNSNPVIDYKTFLNNYLNNCMFMRTKTDSWSDDFNNFGLRMLKVNTLEELELKLTIYGY